jgi:alpha-L-fucosidase
MPAIEWMQQGPFGLMVHWTSDTAPKPDAPDIEDWDERVNAFGVEQFCDEIAATGAGWLIFPFGHGGGLFCSPNAYLEGIVPGRCSKRDLFREIAENLTRRGVRTMAYLTSTPCSDEMMEGFGWHRDPSDKSAFQKKYAGVVREWSQQMGPLISGWWFDCAYSGPRTDFTWGCDRFEGSGWGEAVRAGNPDSVYALNPGANTFQYVSEDEGFLAGEANDLRVRPGQPLIGDKQWHSLVWIDCFWLHTTRGTKIDAPRFFDPELHGYLHRCHANGGAVTLNIGIYQDGTLAEQTLAQVMRMGELMKAGTKPEPINRPRSKYSV